MNLEEVDPDEWDGVWYDGYYGDYFTIEFADDEIRLLDIHNESTYYTYEDEEEFIDDSEEFHQLDPHTVTNPERVIENALSTYASTVDFDTDIALQYARDVTTPVNLDNVEEDVLDALDAAFSSVPPDGRLTRQQARDAVEDAFDNIE